VRIILIGYRGTGKTSVGRALARELHLPFIDTDALIENGEAMRIGEIFRQKGEACFRNLEKGVIQALPRDDAVVSTGGGAILDPENVKMLRAGSTVFLLSADPDTIVRRIRNSQRPPLTELSLADEVRHLLEIRAPYYRSAADYCLDTGTQEVPVLVHMILRLLWEEDIPFREVHRIISEIPPLLTEDQAFLETRSTGGCPLRMYAVIGDPISHSRSPSLFNALFHHYGLPHRYIRMASPSAGTLIELAQIRNFRGLSVTIPHKQAVIPYLDEVDPVAGKIGAVNTIVLCGGRRYGSNTDWLGVRYPLAHLRGKRTVVLGAGGAAAAAIYACQDLDMKVAILNRTPERAAVLAARFACESGHLTDFSRFNPEVVINATPVGMEPDHHTPVPGEWLHREMTVFDLVYTPPLTPFLRAARERGCSVISGVQMFIHQAREQFHTFTGISPPESLVREMLP
jgi:shikimate dehydrogenase